MGVPRPRGNRLGRDERMIPNRIANGGETAARKAFLAGVDIGMQSNLYREYLLAKSGKVREAQLNESVRRGYKLGLVSRMEDWQQKSMAKRLVRDSDLT